MEYRKIKTLRFSSSVYLFTHELPTPCNWPFVSHCPPPGPHVLSIWQAFFLTSHSYDCGAILTASLQMRKPKLGEIQHVLKEYTGRSGSSNFRMQTFYAVLECLGRWRFHAPPSSNPGSPACPRPLFRPIFLFHNLITSCTYLPFSLLTHKSWQFCKLNSFLLTEIFKTQVISDVFARESQ